MICLKKQKIFSTNLVIKKKNIDYKSLGFNRDRNLEYGFRDYKSLKGLFKDNYQKKLSIKEKVQEEFNAVSSELKKCNPRNSASNDEKLRLLNNS